MTKLTLKEVWNRDNEVNGIKICGVLWENYPYMIIKTNETFDDAKKDGFTPVESFRTLAELNKRLKQLTKI